MLIHERRLAGCDPVEASAVGVIDDELVVVTGGPGAVVRLWEVRTGTLRGQPLLLPVVGSRRRGGRASVKAAAVGVVDDVPLVVAGGEIRFDDDCSSGTVWLWNARTGAPWLAPLRHDDRVEAVALGVVDGIPVVVSGGAEHVELAESSTSRGTVHVRDARTGRLRGKPLGHSSGGVVVAVAVGLIDGDPVIVSGGFDQYANGDTVRLWDARSGRLRDSEIIRHAGLRALATGVVDAQPVVVSAGGDGSVRLWDARTGRARGGPVVHGASVKTVAIGVVDAQPVVVSGGRDGMVRVWNGRSGDALGAPLGHDAAVEAVAVDVVDGRPVIVSTAGHSVRLWDARAHLAGVVGSFEAHLAACGRRHGAETGRRLGDLLRALAWVEGEGVPRRLMPVLAGAVAGQALTDDEVTALLDLAAGYVSEATVGGWTVHRLAHEPVREHLLAGSGTGMAGGPAEPAPGAGTTARVHARITEALLAAGRALGGWESADVYLERHLPRHAALAGLVERLWSEPGYLEVADPDAVLAVLPTGDVEAAAAYRRAAPALRGRRPGERAVALDVAAAAWARARGRRAGVRLRWRRGPRASYRQDLASRQGSVDVVAIGVIDGDAIVVSGGEDGTVRFWDACTGAPRGGTLQRHSDPVRAVTIGVVDGRPVVVSGSGGGSTEGSWGTVWLWDARNGTRLGEPAGRSTYVESVAMGVVDGDPVIIAGGHDGTDEQSWGTVRMWNARTLELRHWATRSWARRCRRFECELHHGYNVSGVAFGDVDGEPVIVSVAHDDVRLWDARTGAPRRELAHHMATWATIGTVGGDPVVVSVAGDGVRLWDARTGAPRGGARAPADWAKARAAGVIDGHALTICDDRSGLIGDHPVHVQAMGDTIAVKDWRAGGAGEESDAHDGGVSSVAAGVVDGQPIVVSGGFDWRLRRWDARTGEPRGDPIRHGDRVTSAAIGIVDGQPIIVSGGGDGTLRRWDARTGAPRGDPLRHGAWREEVQVAIGVVDGQPTIVSGSGDGTVRLWDARTGEPKGKAWRGRPWGRRRSHQGRVLSLAVGVVDGRPIVVSGGGEGTVRLWDAGRRSPLGRPGRGHEGAVLAVALGAIGGQPVAISGGADGTVRLWDPRTGAPRDDARRGHDGAVTSVAVGVVDGEPVVISGGADGTVRLWGRSEATVLPVLSSVNSLAVIEEGLVVGTCSSVLVVDLPRLAPSPVTLGDSRGRTPGGRAES